MNLFNVKNDKTSTPMNTDQNIKNPIADRAIANIYAFCQVLNETVSTLKIETGYFPTASEVFQLMQTDNPSRFLEIVNQFLDTELDGLGITNNIMRGNLKKGVEHPVHEFFVMCSKLSLHPEIYRLPDLFSQDGKYKLKQDAELKIYKSINDLKGEEVRLFEEELSKRERTGKMIIQKINDEIAIKPIEFGQIIKIYN